MKRVSVGQGYRLRVRDRARLGSGLGIGFANLEVVVVGVEGMVLDKLRQVVGSGLGDKVHDRHVPVRT